MDKELGRFDRVDECLECLKSSRLGETSEDIRKVVGRRKSKAKEYVKACKGANVDKEYDLENVRDSWICRR